MRLPQIILSCIFFALAQADADAGSGVESTALRPLILRANTYLSVGQFSDAARTYSEAIEQSPADYLLYYKRATAYFSLNRHSNALQDFDTVLRLTNGSFDKALLMKAKILAREANWAEAKKLIKQYTKKAGTADKEAQDMLFSISEGEVATKKAQAASKAKNYEACIEQATEALTTASHAIWLRELRVECALASGDVEQALGDLTRLTHLKPPSGTLFQRVSNMSFYLLPPNTQALQTLKQCLHFDPDSKPCRTSHRLIKAFEKDFTKLDTFEQDSNWVGALKLIVGSGSSSEGTAFSGTGLASKFDEALNAATPALELPPSIRPRTTSPRRLRIFSLACKAYIRSGQIVKSTYWCDETLRMDDKNLDGLLGRGEAKLKSEEWEEAVRAFEQAFEASGRSDRDIGQNLEKARRLLKQSKQKDYYKVLGVSRDADERTIKKAYRKAVMTAHPDKGGSEAKMATVNEAYEVLSSPELRARFDNGDDPNDPSGGQSGQPFNFGHGNNPFQHVFFQNRGPFAGGGGQQFHWSSG